MAARNFSLRPSELFGLNDSGLIHADFDLCCNLRLRLFDIQEQRQQMEGLATGLAAGMVTGATAGALGAERSNVDSGYERW